MFRHSTYDENVFLIPATAALSSFESASPSPTLLLDDAARVLRLNDQYLFALKRCIQLIASSWGWDIDMEAPLRYPHAKQRLNVPFVHDKFRF